MKLSITWSIVGFFLPIIGVIIGKILMTKNEIVARSIRRGSALSTIVLALVGSFLIYALAMGFIGKK